MSISLYDLLFGKNNFFEELSNRQANYVKRYLDNILCAIHTGFNDLDNLGGLEEYGINVIGSKHGIGKTSLAIDIALNIVSLKFENKIHNVNTVYYLSFELTKDKLANKIIAKESEVNATKIQMGNLNGIEYQRIVGSVHKLIQSDFKVFDELPKNEDELLEFLYNNCQEGDVVFIDYLDLIISNCRFEPYTSGVDFIRRIKLFATYKKVTFIILSQLTKKIDERPGHRPILSDLPYGVLSNHADRIFLFHRCDYYDTYHKPGISELMIAKNRNIFNLDNVKVTLSYNKEYDKYLDFKDPFLNKSNSDEFSQFAPD